jgi:hypothetical protein
VGAETFRLCRGLVDGVVLVDNAAISAAIKDVFNETRSILEPAGAVAVAGAKAWLAAGGHKVGPAGVLVGGEAPCCVCSQHHSTLHVFSHPLPPIHTAVQGCPATHQPRAHF